MRKILSHVLIAITSQLHFAYAANYSAGWTGITLSNNIAGLTATYTLSADNPSSGGSGCVNSCIPFGSVITITFPAGADATTATVAGSTFGGSAIASFTTQTATVITFTAPVSVAKGSPFSVVIKNVTNPSVAATYTALTMTAANISPGTNTFSGGASGYLIAAPPPMSSQVVTGGGNHSLAVCIDGTARSWGQDVYGELGNNATLLNQVSPVAVISLTSIVSVSAGFFHSLALRSDGTVWTWGRNNYGQLGDGTTSASQPTPIQVGTLSGIVAVSGGEFHSLALKNDGTVWSWGRDNYGQLGDGGANTNQLLPVQITTLSGINAVSAGLSFSLALKNDGTVWSWGDDFYGQLGDGGANLNQASPVQVASLTGIIAIAAGTNHAFALKSDGTVWSWGRDADGQLGNNAMLADQPAPVAVAVLTGITAIASGGYHGLALKNDSTVWAWGDDSNGQLGDNTALADQPTPVAVASMTGISGIGAGGWHSFALDNSGTLWSWGYDGSGQLGNGGSNLNQALPVQVISLCSMVLPLELLDFNGHRSGVKIVLNWTSASAPDHDYFTVERSADGNIFEEIGRVQEPGTKNSPAGYSFTDAHPFNGKNYYRLSHTGKDGAFAYSRVIAVNAEMAFSLQEIQVTGDQMRLQFVLSAPGAVNYSITDITGRKVSGGGFGWMRAGEQQQVIPRLPLNRGIYYLGLTFDGQTGWLRLPVF